MTRSDVSRLNCAAFLLLVSCASTDSHRLVLERGATGFFSSDIVALRNEVRHDRINSVEIRTPQGYRQVTARDIAARVKQKQQVTSSRIVESSRPQDAHQAACRGRPVHSLTVWTKP